MADRGSPRPSSTTRPHDELIVGSATLEPVLSRPVGIKVIVERVAQMISIQLPLCGNHQEHHVHQSVDVRSHPHRSMCSRVCVAYRSIRDGIWIDVQASRTRKEDERQPCPGAIEFNADRVEAIAKIDRSMYDRIHIDRCDAEYGLHTDQYAFEHRSILNRNPIGKRRTKYNQAPGAIQCQSRRGHHINQSIDVR